MRYKITVRFLNMISMPNFLVTYLTLCGVAVDLATNIVLEVVTSSFTTVSSSNYSYDSAVNVLFRCVSGGVKMRR